MNRASEPAALLTPLMLAALFRGSRFFLAGDDLLQSGWPVGIVATRIFSRYHGLGPRRAYKKYIVGQADVAIEIVVSKAETYRRLGFPRCRQDINLIRYCADVVPARSRPIIRVDMNRESPLLLHGRACTARLRRSRLHATILSLVQSQLVVNKTAPAAFGGCCLGMQ